MRKVAAAACLALCSTVAQSADYGIGVSAKSDDAWIYAPIEFSQAFRLEPSVRFGSSKLSYSQTSLGTFSSIEDQYEQKGESLEIGVGAFGLAKLTDSARFYYGARAAYVDAETKTTSTTTFGSGSPSTSRSKTSQDGYRAGPAIGFEYLIGTHLSIGGEAGYMFLDVEGKSKVSSSSSSRSPVSENSQKSSGTQTQLILRYKF